MTLRSLLTKISSLAAVVLCAGAISLAVADTADAQGRHSGGMRAGGGGGFAGRSMAAPRTMAGPRSYSAPRAYMGGRRAIGGANQNWLPRHHGPYPRHHRHWPRYYGGYWGGPYYGYGFYDPYPVYGAPVYYERCVMRKRYVKRHHRWVRRWVRVCYY